MKYAETDLELAHLETTEDVAQHLELMRSVFGQNSRIDLLVKKWIDHHPSMTLKDFLVIKHRKKMVACLNLIPSKWSIGGIPLKVAELGCVATLPEHRHQGLQRRLMTGYHRRVEEEGYDLSAIEGIPYYYRQFGYEYALPLDEQTRIGLEKVPDGEIKHRIRPFNNCDVPKAMQLLAKSQEKFYVHSVRDEGIWRMQEETGMISEYRFERYAVEEKGGMVAYFRISENPENKELMVREVTDLTPSMGRSILGFLKDLGRQRGLETLVTTASRHEFFIKQIMAIGEAVQSPPYAWQIRVTDYARAFQKLKPLFEERLATSNDFKHLNMQLYFNFYRYTIQMTTENGTITKIQRLDTCEDRNMRFNPLVFVQLLLGYRSREELETVYPDLIVKTSHKPLVDMLFPKLPSYIHTDY
jgi:predicted acetyltransferase